MKSRNLNLIIATLTAVLLCITGLTASAQGEQDMTYKDLERLEDDNIVYYTEIYRIVDDYPDFEYTYKYEGGELEEVIVKGVDNNMDRKRLEVLIFNYKKNKELMENIPTRAGIYYSVEEDAKPENGYETFYRNLRSNLQYPQGAREWGAEGNVYVHFVVDEDGEVCCTKAIADIESSVEQYIEDMKNAALQAVAETSGNWDPAMINGEAVAQFGVLPVLFRLEPHPNFPKLYF